MSDAWMILAVVLAGAAVGLIAGFYLLVPRIDPRLEALRKRNEVEPDAPVADDRAAHAAAVLEATELMRQGRKIEAVKVYRERTGVSLAEAKAAVERL